jgi:hypothetical protein
MWWVLASSGQLGGVVNSVGDYVKQISTSFIDRGFVIKNASSNSETIRIDS